MKIFDFWPDISQELLSTKALIIQSAIILAKKYHQQIWNNVKTFLKPRQFSEDHFDNVMKLNYKFIILFLHNPDLLQILNCLAQKAVPFLWFNKNSSIEKGWS